MADRVRSIPARAGETPCWSELGGFASVYPRTGGGNEDDGGAGALAPGLSPHGRGKPIRKAPGRCVPGSIPARAGETVSSRGEPRVSPVYPRTGGGNQ